MALLGLVLGTVGSEQKIAYAQSSGYDHVFLRDGFVEAVQRVTAGRGVDVVLDPSGEPTRSQSLSLLAPFEVVTTQRFSLIPAGFHREHCGAPMNRSQSMCLKGRIF